VIQKLKNLIKTTRALCIYQYLVSFSRRKVIISSQKGGGRYEYDDSEHDCEVSKQLFNPVRQRIHFCFTTVIPARGDSLWNPLWNGIFLIRWSYERGKRGRWGGGKSGRSKWRSGSMWFAVNAWTRGLAGPPSGSSGIMHGGGSSPPGSVPKISSTRIQTWPPPAPFLSTRIIFAVGALFSNSFIDFPSTFHNKLISMSTPILI
jgi:hypothetical protein